MSGQPLPPIGIMMIPQTIAAIATPPGKGGIGIIKISGKDAIPIASSIFKKSGVRPGEEMPPFESHRLYHGYIVDPDRGRVLDEVLLSVMKAPRSYTREDVVEINAHSGWVVLSEILELLVSRGARLASPGEFTKRAFLNGRIDLTQAEGIVDIINARTKKALEIASVQARGYLGESVQSIRKRLIRILAEVEADIDFADDASNADIAGLSSSLQEKVIEPISGILQRYSSAQLYRDGVRVAVVGRPNVGKSSLINRLIRKDRVIVTPVPGTTRDIIEEELEIEGIPLIISDTAGLHPSDDPVESIGIRKTKECIHLSDVIFFLIEAGCDVTEEDFEIYRLIEKKRVLLIVNKIDLQPAGKDFFLPENWHLPTAMISVLKDQGIDRLERLFVDSFSSGRCCGQECSEDRWAPNLRQKILLEKSLNDAVSAFQSLREKLPIDLAAIDLREALDALGEITGDTVQESILDEIFRHFCIGK